MLRSQILKFQSEHLEDKHSDISFHKADGKKHDSLTDYYQTSFMDSINLGSYSQKMKINVKGSSNSSDSSSNKSSSNNGSDSSANKLLVKRVNPTKLVDYEDDGDGEGNGN